MNYDSIFIFAPQEHTSLNDMYMTVTARLVVWKFY